MPPYNWPVDPVGLIQQFEARHSSPAAGALFLWAVWVVDSLHYLDDLDQAFDRSRVPLAGHSPAVVDVAHARWATSNSITSLDLCAAGLGRAFCAHRGPKELALRNFDPAGSKPKPILKLRAKLPPVAQQWIDHVLAAPQYKDVKCARDSLTHSKLNRHFVLKTGGLPERLTLEFGKKRMPVRSLIELARDLATRHVSDFLQLLPQL